MIFFSKGKRRIQNLFYPRNKAQSSPCWLVWWLVCLDMAIGLGAIEKLRSDSNLFSRIAKQVVRH
jgi:hypothetical protein